MKIQLISYYAIIINNKYLLFLNGHKLIVLYYICHCFCLLSPSHTSAVCPRESPTSSQVRQLVKHEWFGNSVKVACLLRVLS